MLTLSGKEFVETGQDPIREQAKVTSTWTDRGGETEMWAGNDGRLMPRQAFAVKRPCRRRSSGTWSA